jgi:hypothetical protein
MPDQLDAALRDLATEIEFPTTPDLRGAVAARLGGSSVRSWWRWTVARALVLAALAVLLLAAAAVLLLPGLRITPVQTVPTASVPADGLATRLALGERVPLEMVEAALPSALGAPDEVYSSRAGEVISLVYSSRAELPELADTGIGILVQQINGSLDRERVEKLVVEFGVTVTPVEVAGVAGFWIDGPPHLIRYTGPAGEARSEMTRLVGDTLVWQRGDVLYRIESGLGLVRTLRIAESIGD